jgi:hypothetical protein
VHLSHSREDIFTFIPILLGQRSTLVTKQPKPKKKEQRNNNKMMSLQQCNTATKGLLVFSVLSFTMMTMSGGTANAQMITVDECAERLPTYDMDASGRLTEEEFVNFLLGQRP